MLKKSPLNQLKVIEGLFRKANYKGVYTQLLFYYRLKELNVEGHFMNIPVMESFCRSYVYKQFKKLQELGWIVKKVDGYYLISYDLLFESFGYDLTKQQRIFKIEKKWFKQFELIIAYSEIKLNIFRQHWALKIKTEDLMQKKSRLQTAEDTIIESYCTLSCLGISHLLGFMSAKKGYQIEQELKKLDLIEIEKRFDKRRGLPLCNYLFIKKTILSFS
jgi:biotin operon repressor